MILPFTRHSVWAFRKIKTVAENLFTFITFVQFSTFPDIEANTHRLFVNKSRSSCFASLTEIYCFVSREKRKSLSYAGCLLRSSSVKKHLPIG